MFSFIALYPHHFASNTQVRSRDFGRRLFTRRHIELRPGRLTAFDRKLTPFVDPYLLSRKSGYRALLRCRKSTQSELKRRRSGIAEASGARRCRKHCPGVRPAKSCELRSACFATRERLANVLNEPHSTFDPRSQAWIVRTTYLICHSHVPARASLRAHNSDNTRSSILTASEHCR